MTFNHDSAVYIESGFKYEAKVDRPIIYGLFISLISRGYSLWIITLFQALMTAVIIHFSFKYASAHSPSALIYILFVILITFFMSAGFEVSWIMPDAFTATTILSTVLLILVPSLSKTDFMIISCINILSNMMHNSHTLIAVLLSFLVVFCYLFKRIRSIYSTISLRLVRVLYIWVLAIISSVTVATIQSYAKGGDFKSSHGGVIFLMSNLVEMGVVDEYLSDSCWNKNYKICGYINKIPNNFLWDENSPLRKTGGWIANEKEYFEIEKDLLKTPKYSTKIIFKSLIYTIKQYFNFDIIDFGLPSDYVKETIGRYFKRESQDFFNSKQSQNKINFNFINYSQTVIVLTCLVFYVIILMNYYKFEKSHIVFLILILASTIINAAVCSFFSGVYSRYQARVVWLLPLPLFIILVNHFRVHLNYITSKIINLVNRVL